MEPEPVEERLAKALEALEATRTAVAEAGRRMREASVTTMSKDRSVEVTLGPRGDLLALRFHDGRYRKMAPAQLSAVLIETIGTAREQMTRLAVNTYRPISESLPQLPGMSDAEIDWDELFGVGETDDSPSRRKPGNRLRDEIVEDPT